MSIKPLIAQWEPVVNFDFVHNFGYNIINKSVIIKKVNSMGEMKQSQAYEANVGDIEGHLLCTQKIPTGRQIKDPDGDVMTEYMYTWKQLYIVEKGTHNKTQEMNRRKRKLL